jgi:hypothetical protein
MQTVCATQKHGKMAVPVTPQSVPRGERGWQLQRARAEDKPNEPTIWVAFPRILKRRGTDEDYR